MRKIILVNRYFFPDHSATSQLLADLAFGLASGPYARVLIVTSRQLYDNPRVQIAARERIEGVEVIRVGGTRFGRGNLLGRAIDYLSFYVCATTALLGEARRGDIIVAKTDPPLISVFAALVSVVRKSVLVNWVQDMFPEVATALNVRGIWLLQPISKWARNVSFRVARKNVALGAHMADRITREGIPPAKVTVIHNWADGKTLRPVPRDANRLRLEWGIGDRFVVAYSGNFGRAHDFKTLLDAAQQLKDDARLVFVFIGGGAYQNWINSQVNQRGLTNVLVKPYQPREILAESLSVADVHVISLLPSLEGLIVPSKFYGVAAVGRPTLFIGDPDGEIGRLVTSGDCGFAVRIGDVAGVVRAVQQLCDDPHLCDRLGANARALLEKRFDKTIALASWRSVLQGIAA